MGEISSILTREVKMMGKELWNQPAPVEGATAVKEREAPAAISETAAAAVAEVSHYQLAERGWCAWQCQGLGGDTIIVVVDETFTNYPRGYPVYTLRELYDILSLDDKLLQAAHRAKKELGARIEGPEEKKNG
jgi:hypothetical protein